MKITRRKFGFSIFSFASLYGLQLHNITGSLKKNSTFSVNQSSRVFKDDFSNRGARNFYNFQGTGKEGVSTRPIYTNDGPGGRPSLTCRMPKDLIPYKNSRSEVSLLMRGSDFNREFELEWGQEYGYRQAFKLKSNGASNGYRCVFFQTHTPPGAPRGASPLVGLRCYPDRPVEFFINGSEKDLAPTDVIFNCSDFFDRWCILVADLRYNYGDETMPSGYCNLYLSIGTKDVLPSIPDFSDRIHAYQGNIGFNVEGHGPGYFKAGVYETDYKKAPKTEESAIEMVIDELLLQDGPLVTTS